MQLRLLQLRLLVECLQILTPPMMTVKRIGDGEFDLIDNLHSLVRLLALALWQRLATDLKPRHLNNIVRKIELDQLPEVFAAMLKQETKGRIVVVIGGQ